jgi:hypothetical protein
MIRHLMALAAFACAGNPSPPPETERPKGEVDAALTSNGVKPRAEKAVSIEVDRCPTGGSLQAPIVVANEARIVRDPPLTSFLVPVSRQAALHSLNGIGVFDSSGKRLPAQLETLSRWGGHPNDCARPIRYAYARVSATPAPNQTVTWTVKSATKEELTPLLLETTADAWIIDTGVARFTVRRDRFDGISNIELPREGGFDPLGRSTFYLDHAGTLRQMKDAEVWKLELERAGPQVVTVVARGYYPGSAQNRRRGPNPTRGLGFTVRLHFHARSSIVRVEHTYYHGAVADWGATGLTNTTIVQRAWMSVTLAEPADKIYARADGDIHTLDPKQIVQVEQTKRTPDKPDVKYAIFSGDRTVEHGERAKRPFLAAVTPKLYAIATIARMAEREPQGFTWSNQLNALDVDFTSAPIQIGAARGIWSVAALDFGRGTPTEARAEALQLFAERPLLGAPAPSYANGTRSTSVRSR